MIAASLDVEGDEVHAVSVVPLLEEVVSQLEKEKKLPFVSRAKNLVIRDCKLGFPDSRFIGSRRKISRFGKFQIPIGKSGNGLLNLFQALALTILESILKGCYCITNLPPYGDLS